MSRLILLVGILIGFSSYGDTSGRSDALSDRAVYEAVIHTLSNCDEAQQANLPRRQLIVQQRMTGLPKGLFDFTMAQRALSILQQTGGPFYRQPAWAAFLASVDSARFTERLLDQPVETTCYTTTLWSYAQIDQQFANGRNGYAELANRICRFGGIISLSNVVYATDRRKAICYCSYIWDFKAGRGELIFLEHRRSVWTVVGTARLWIA